MKLTEAVEPEAPKFEDTIASWAIRYDEVVRLLAEAATEMERLRQGLAEAKAEQGRLYEKLTAALAEIPRLEARCDNEMLRRKEAERLLAAKCKALKADAEIGGLMRNVENKTGVHYCDGQYYALRFGWKASRTIGYVAIAESKSDSPAEALRSIQASE